MKRLASIIFILLASFVFLFAVYVLVLFVAPGYMVFGLKYILPNTHVWTTGQVSITEKWGSFSEIEVNTSEIPVYVVFTEGYSFQFEYYDNFNGITTSTFDDPTISYSEKVNGKVGITTHEYRKFIFENTASTRYFKLYIPLVSVSSTNYYSISINSEKSDVYFIKDDESDNRIPKLNTISVNTTGKIYYQTSVQATTYKLKTKNSVTISNDSQFITATNFSIESTSGKITINKEVSGDLSLTTNSGNIKLVSCKNLTVRTNFGNVSSAGDAPISVSGVVDIESKAGNVTLGKVTGTGTNRIVTSSGNVTIDEIQNGSITTTRGSVAVLYVNNFTITTSTGRVEVDESGEALNVTTKRGNITLGVEGISMKNVTANSNLGNIVVNSASGTTNLSSLSGKVNFKNNDSSNITIYSGGKLTAAGLMGTVTITAQKDVSLDFANLNGKASVTLGDGCSAANIYLLGNTKDSIGYSLAGKSVTLYEQNKNGSFSQLQSTFEQNISYPSILKVTSSNANISLYFKGSY